MSGQLQEQVESVLNNCLGIQYTSNQEASNYRFQVTYLFQDNPNLAMDVKVEQQRKLILIRTDLVNERIGEGAKDKSLRFIARANEILEFGNIDLFIEGMRFSYRTSQAFPNDIDATRVIRYMIDNQKEIIPKLSAALVDLETSDNPEFVANHHFASR